MDVTLETRGVEIPSTLKLVTPRGDNLVNRAILVLTYANWMLMCYAPDVSNA